MITYQKAAELLRYDPDTGTLYWRMDRGGPAKAGTVAGAAINKRGRVRIRLLGGRYMASDLAFLLHHQRWPAARLDHDDGCESNNRITNLTEATQSQNSRNRCRASNNTSGVTGVSWHTKTKKWRAYIRGKEKKLHHLGLFDSLEEAAKARASAEANFGYHQRHGRR